MGAGAANRSSAAGRGRGARRSEGVAVDRDRPRAAGGRDERRHELDLDVEGEAAREVEDPWRAVVVMGEYAGRRYAVIAARAAQAAHVQRVAGSLVAESHQRCRVVAG